VKQFRSDAADQRCVLDGFQAQGWPPRIADPRPRRPGRNRKKHLRQTGDALKRCQKPLRIRFHGDRTAMGVRWEEILGWSMDRYGNATAMDFLTGY
jgi:hypothetical protein